MGGEWWEYLRNGVGGEDGRVGGRERGRLVRREGGSEQESEGARE